MKNFLQIVFFFALIFTATQMTAQIKVGFKVGVVDANQKVSIDGSLGLLGVEYESRVGYNFGVFAEMGDGNMRFQPELLFSSKGSFRAADVNAGLGDRDHVLNYLEIPLQLKYYVIENDNFSAYGLGGAYVGFAIGGKVKEEGVDTDYEFTFDDEDLLGYDGGLDFGVPLGVGINLAVGPGHIVGEARYHFGMRKVQKSNLFDTTGPGAAFNVKNRSTALNVGYMISF